MLLFSDLDGTLLDSIEDVGTTVPRLREARQLGRVVIVSSRTIPDLLRQFGLWGWAGDCIGENGAQIATRDPVLAQRLALKGLPEATLGDYHVFRSGRATPEWLPGLRHALQAAGLRFDLEVHAAVRESSLLLDPLPRSSDMDLLGRVCRAEGLHLAHGGEFVAIWSGHDKGEAARLYAGNCGFAAIGNAGNDLSLLAAATTAFVIRNPGSGHHPGLAGLPGVRLLDQTGAAGWVEALHRLRGNSP